jgi:DNA-binding LytR/AlgR family response regulator
MKCSFIAILDDSKNLSDALKKQIATVLPDFSVPVYAYKDTGDFMNFLRNQQSNWGIILLDIVLEETDGINLAIRLKQQCSFWKIIFITGYTKYLSDIFRANPDGLLYKPISDHHLKNAILSVSDQIEESEKKCISVNSVKSGSVRINEGEILYLESEQRIIHIHTRDKIIDTYAKLDEFHSLLPEYFIRCHKSYIVNLYDATKLSENGLTLSDNTVIPVSRSRKKQVKEAFFKHLMPGNISMN